MILIIAVAAAVSALVVPALATAPAAAAATLSRPEGAGPPVAASGMGTSAALDNPRCRLKNPAGQVLSGGYGRFDSTVVGGGPTCVKEWKAGADNGGATSQGVTKDKITVVAVLPNEQELESDPVTPKHKADKSGSTYEDAIHDYVLPQMKFFETWGRDVEFKFLTSSGSDEAAQRADVVAIKAMKPFAVFHLIVAGLDVLETELAKAHIPVMGYSTTATKANLQAPYRWGLSDAQSSAINSAEVIGKQLVGKKAAYAGDDVKSQTRKFGVVYIPTLVDIDNFKSFFKKYGGTLASENPYAANGSTFGDSTVSEEQAPTMVTRMKAAGVTTVIMLSDFSMNKALMENATKQEWFPEWFFTGAIYADIGILSRIYPADQSVHAFGLSFLSPYTELDPAPPPPQLPLSTLDDSLNWYWGVDAGTQAGAVSLEHPLALEWYPGRGAEPHAEDVRAGLVRDPGIGWRGPEPCRQLPQRIRQGSGAAVRRVRAERPRLRARTGGTPPPPARRTARERWARAWVGTPTVPSGTRPARGRRSSSAGSTRTRRCTTSRPGRARRPPTWVIARIARHTGAPARPARAASRASSPKPTAEGKPRCRHTPTQPASAERV